MATTETQLKAVSTDVQTENDDETPTVRRSEVAQVMPTPGVERFGDWAEWEQLTDVVRDGVVAAINE